MWVSPFYAVLLSVVVCNGIGYSGNITFFERQNDYHADSVQWNQKAVVMYYPSLVEKNITIEQFIFDVRRIE